MKPKRYSMLSIVGILLLVTLLSSPVTAAQAPSSESITLVLKAPAYQLNPVEGGRTAIDAEGCSLLGEPGQPLLPHKRVDVALPPDVDWDSLILNIRDVQTVTLPGTYKLRIAEPYRSCADPVADFLDSEAEALPIARIAATGQMRKWHVARVAFSPFQYDQHTEQLHVVEQVTVELRFARTGKALDADLLADTVMDDVAATQFVNYEAARDWYPRVDRLTAHTYDYAIVTTNTIFSSSSKLSAFIAHQQSRGYNVLVVTEDDYGYVGDRADNVRQWLVDNYSLGIKYVLLIGHPDPALVGITSLPMKMCWPMLNDPYYGSIETPTDYYFADLTGDWDKNGDGYYGEFDGDWDVPSGGVDLLPEVYVGRIPLYDSYADLDDILQKTIDYQNETDTSWRKSSLLPMSFMGPGDDGAPFAEQMRDDFLGPAGYSSWRMYQLNGICGDASSYSCDEELLGGTVVRDRWAANDYGIVAWWGHGNETMAGVGYPADPDCGEGVLFSSSQTAALDDEHPVFTYQSSCSTGWPEHSENLQYSILLHGGIATVGATRGSYNGPFTYGDFDQSDGNAGIGYAYLHRVVNGYAAGEALYQATFLSVPYIVSKGGLANFYVFNLYGDPAVRITDASTNGKSRLTIPAAAFTPHQDGYDYQNHGRYLVHQGGPEGWYLAPVHLPHGAQVTKMTVHWYNDSQTGQAQARLQRTEFGQGNYLEMAYATTGLGGVGYGLSQDDTIAYATIDNLKYAYWATFDLPATADVRGCSIVIEYIPPAMATGRLSIPAAAFKPYEDGYDYVNDARFLEHYHSPGGGTANGWYLAPVFLPHGATVTKMTFHWHDTSDATGQARLQRTELGTGDLLEMAYAETSDGIYPFDSSYDDTIDYATIDNSKYAYWVVWDLPVPEAGAPSNYVSGCGLVVEYDLPAATTSTGYISVPAAAFTPFADEWEFENHGRYLKHLAGASRAHYQAPIPLPQGATITKMTFHYYDEWPATFGYAHLSQADLTDADDYFDMAYIESLTSGYWGWNWDDTIISPIVDNTQHSYWAYWDLPSSSGNDNVWGTGLVIEYTYRVYLPIVLRQVP